MEVRKVLESDKTKYDQYVANHSVGTFLQSWDWGQWQENCGKKVFRYFFIDEKNASVTGSNEKIVGSAQATLVNTAMGNYFYCAYGPLWNENLSNVEINTLLQLLRNELQKAADVFFVRIEPTLQKDLLTVGAVKAESVQPPQTLIKSIVEEEDELLASFHHKTRYNIRVAQKHNVTITSTAEPTVDAIDLIMQTSQRQNYRNHSRAYIKSLWDYFFEQASEPNNNLKMTGYIARQDDTPLASGLMIDFGKTRMYLFGGSNYEHRNLMGPYLMHWQAMLDAKSEGFTMYDFGAAENASGHSGGYARFKMGFNPEVINFSGTHDLVIKPGKYKLYRMARTLNRLVKHVRK